MKTKHFLTIYRPVWFYIAALVITTPSIVFAAEVMPVPADLQVSLVLKILTYDRALKDRCGGNIEIGILYAAGSKESEGARDAIVKFMPKLSRKTNHAEWEQRVRKVCRDALTEMYGPLDRPSGK